MTEPCYEVFALRYATRAARRGQHFIGGDPHDGPMNVDYYLWVIRNSERLFVVDVGFDAAMAATRKRTFLRHPADALKLLGIDAASVEHVIITHLHYDHVGTFRDFPKAQFHLQDDEMAYATGRHMCNGYLGHAYEVEEVADMVRLVYQERVTFHRGAAELAPGVSVHRIGGHTAGMQSVRVATQRGWVVLASDAGHYYEHIETDRCYSGVYDLAEMMDGYDTLRGLAESPRHIIPGHDPLVMARYPAPRQDLEGIVVRLDVMPHD